MLYRVLRTINANFTLAVFWIYVLAFVVAWSLVFVIPLGPIIPENPTRVRQTSENRSV